ncbi:WXG100 family type VII secretion target [Streptomyces sp. NPDC005799]|uniref:WXG100 family type VII secretion target n=1 Tax=Streptomyces sp. NPDC005799 TaxID=3154678 RepID=UPI0033E55304
MSDGIYIDHTQAIAIAHELNSLNANIGKIVDHLKQQLGTLVDEWVGTDRDTYYNQIIPQWNEDMGKCNIALGNLILVLQDNSATLRNASLQSADAFHGI